jgi:putative phosphoribosyl transferase
MTMLFRDRREAGRLLARRLVAYSGRLDVVVLALPRGGVPVAHEIAQALGVPLDIFLVRKLGVPGYEELAMGAIATSGATVLDPEIVRAYGVTDEDIRRVTANERQELSRRERVYRGDRPPLDLAARTLILVDDGLATGSSMRAALAALEPLPAARVVVAVPVAPRATAIALEDAVDEFVCLAAPEPFFAVGDFYEDFRQVTDAEVREALEASWRTFRREVHA